MYNHDEAFTAWGMQTLDSRLYIDLEDLKREDPSLFETLSEKKTETQES